MNHRTHCTSLVDAVALQVCRTHCVCNNSALTIKDWIHQRCGFGPGSNRRCFCGFAHWVANFEERHGPRPRRQRNGSPYVQDLSFLLHHGRS